MKKATLAGIICLGIFYFTNAQNVTISDSTNMTIQRWQDTCFSLLNLTSSNIPTGYLLDFSLAPWSDSAFNSPLYSNVDTITDMGGLLALCGILNSSVVNSSGTVVANTDSLFINAYRYQRDNYNIPLLFLYRPYQKIRKTALSQGLFTISSDSFRLKDVSGRMTSPYDNEYVFAFSPFQNQITQYGNVSFALPAQFWLMPGVSSVQVDFGDGAGYRTLSQNSTASIYYPATGTYYLNAKITTSAGTFIAKSSIQYTAPKFYIKADSSWTISVPPLYTSISQYITAHQSPGAPGTQPPSGSGTSCLDGSIFNTANCDINPTATVYIVNGCDHVLDKPIYVVEGFDPANTTTINTLEFYVDNFLASTSADFFTTMREAGYDFVFVKFTNNTDFIENNAMVMEQVITRVNNAKTGTNKGTVIGFSMGSLIARWALRDMENQKISHQVANYISYDGPHQGANVPLGFQYLFTEMLTDMPYLKYSKEVNTLYGSFTSRAAQEMLVTYATGNNGSPISPIRPLFAQALINMGYPATTNNYAIAQGRGNNTSGTTNAGVGTQFGFSGGAQIFNGSILFLLANFVSSVYAVNTTSPSLILNYVYFGLKVSHIFGIPVPHYTVRPYLVYYKSPNPYDDAPAGYENTQAQFVYNFNNKLVKILGYTLYNNGIAPPASDDGHYGHAFVPVSSALDLQNQGYGSSNSFQSNNMYFNIDNSIQSPGQVTGNTLNPTSLSPFKSVMTYTTDCGTDICQSNAWEDGYLYINNINPAQGSSWNEWHEGDFSNQTQLFAQRKILGTGTFPACSIDFTLCDTSQNSVGITGQNYVCTTGSFALSSVYPIQGVTYQWSFPNGTLQVTGGQGTPNITVAEVYPGIETVTCQIINSCGATSIYQYNVTVGSVITGNVNNGGTNFPMNTVNTVVAGATQVSFQWPGTTGINCFQSSTNPPPSQTGFIFYPSNNTFWFTLSSGQSITVGFTGNGCGGSLNASRSFTVGGHQFLIAPNPANSTVTISSNIQSTELKTGISNSNTTISAVRIMDVTGTVRIQQAFSAATTLVQMNVSGLIPGAYFVQISNGTYTETQQLIINR